MSNAHENIDNEILLNTLNRIDPSTIERLLHASSGDAIQGLYGARTIGGEKRFLDRFLFGRLESPEALQDMDWGTRQTVLQNPDFADTLAAADVPEFKQSMKDMNTPLLKLLLRKLFGG